MAKAAHALNDRIHHAVYGPGTIIEANERHLTILFDGAGKKKFVTSKVVLSRTDTPAPAKPAPKTRKKAASAK